MQYMVITRRRSEKFPESDYTPERLAAETAAVRKLYGALDRLPLFGLGMQEAVSIVPLVPYRGFAAE